MAAGPGADKMALSPQTHTLFVVTREGKVAKLDTSRCDARVQTGCAQTPTAAPVGVRPDKPIVAGDTLYVSDLLTGDLQGRTVHVIDAGHCCADAATVTVGRAPQGMVVDAATQTLYTANQGFDDEPGSLSAVDIRHCTSHDVSGCGAVAPRVATGLGPIALALDPATHRVFSANYGDSSVSVVDGATCNALRTTGCGRPAIRTAVGNYPGDVAFDPAAQLLYVPTSWDGEVALVPVG